MKGRIHPQQPMRLFAVLLTAALLLAACQPGAAPATSTMQPNTAPLASNTSAPTSAPMATSTTAPTTAATAIIPETGSTPSGPVTLNVATDSELGPILVDDQGMVLYMFTNDEPNKSNCAGGCLQAWPPFLTNGDPVAGEGVDETLIGNAPMADGSTIVTYNEMPLYYWVSDMNPGDTLGQGVNDVWYVVNPEGEPVGMPGATPEAAAQDPNAVTLNVVDDPEFGEILVDGKGMTLYMFTRDEPNKSNCAGGCLQAWPPFLAEGEVAAGEGVDEALIGTADMPDGTKIVTYNEMPLYYWASDMNAGDTLGQGVNDVWYVVNPAGEPVGMP